MRLIMSGIDHKTAPVAVRERFSVTAARAGEIAARLREHPGVEGCVLLSTCNRTETYMTYNAENPPDPAELLSRAMEADGPAIQESARECFVTRTDRAAAMHLMMVACGLRSMVRGEDQIVTQVGAAISAARESSASCPVLETLFRTAVTAAKRVKTHVPLSPVESSVAGLAVKTLSDEYGSLGGKRALVVGSGETGRLTARLLRDSGCGVSVTVRSYKSGLSPVPEGCTGVPYAERYTHIPGCDFVVSATSSPHLTLRARELSAPYPAAFIDLAVPRDIDPEIGLLAGVRLWNVDDLGGGRIGGEDARKLAEIREILTRQYERFQKWERGRLEYAGRKGGESA